MLTETPVGSMNYNVLRCIIIHGNILRLNRGAEIGVLYGDTSDYLLKEFSNLTLFSVDPWIEYNDDTKGRSDNSMKEYETVTRERLARFGKRSQIIKDFSVNAATAFSEGSLDFVFIDANHLYEFVKQDIQTWYPLVRSGGLIAGHDYKSFPGVTQAVDEFSVERGLKGFHTPIASDVWFFVKP